MTETCTLHSIAFIVLINIVMSQASLSYGVDIITVWLSPQFLISNVKCYKVMAINYIITNALDANIPGLAEFWNIVSHYCIGIIFLRRLPSRRGVQVDSECYTLRPFIIVTGYSQNEPWKIFAFNLVPPNLVLKKLLCSPHWHLLQSFSISCY